MCSGASWHTQLAALTHFPTFTSKLWRLCTLRIQREHQGAVDPRQADWQRIDTAFACFCNLALPSLDRVQKATSSACKSMQMAKRSVMASWRLGCSKCTLAQCTLVQCTFAQCTLLSTIGSPYTSDKRHTIRPSQTSFWVVEKSTSPHEQQVKEGRYYGRENAKMQNTTSFGSCLQGAI